MEIELKLATAGPSPMANQMQGMPFPNRKPGAQGWPGSRLGPIDSSPNVTSFISRRC